MTRNTKGLPRYRALPGQVLNLSEQVRQAEARLKQLQEIAQAHSSAQIESANLDAYDSAEDVSNTVGQLTLDRTGNATYHGETASSEYLERAVKSEERDEGSDLRDPVALGMPPEIVKLGFVPNKDRALQLIELYYSFVTWIYKIGLQKDCVGCGFDEDEIQRRRVLFWEFYSYDLWTSIVAGRPHSMNMWQIDCRFPDNVTPGSAPSETVRLDYLLYMHRSYLLRAIRAEPLNPLGHQFGPSVLAAYNSALRLLYGTRGLYTNHPEWAGRRWHHWTQNFSAIMVLGVLVIEAPGCSLAQEALKELEDAIPFYEMGTRQCRPAFTMVGLAIPPFLIGILKIFQTTLENVLKQAQDSFAAFNASKPGLNTLESSTHSALPIKPPLPKVNSAGATNISHGSHIPSCPPIAAPVPVTPPAPTSSITYDAPPQASRQDVSWRSNFSRDNLERSTFCPDAVGYIHHSTFSQSEASSTNEALDAGAYREDLAPSHHGHASTTSGLSIPEQSRDTIWDDYISKFAQAPAHLRR
ncbi:hypothetical protein HWV62_25124 [Athelia sp. TMB]|nr:hypothetical protein HWV62_25124 [Athelia sp. TMB]